MSFVVASIFTTLGADQDERAQAIAVMVYDKLASAVSDHVAGKVTAAQKKPAGPILCTLMFTALKAISLPALPSAMRRAAEIVHKKEGSAEEAEQSGHDDIGGSNESASKPLSHPWMLENLFGVISRTDDAPRRLLLCKWYLEDIQNLTTGGRL